MLYKKIIITISILSLLIFLPGLSWYLVLVNLVFLCVFMGMQLLITLLPINNPSQLNVSSGKEFVSIHVAIHNEPPGLVIKTLKALSLIDYPAYEVLVLDNNTKDKSVWLPVKRFCDSRNNIFKFWHEDNVKGYKAGALNLLMDKTSPDAEFIAVVDADYVVEPGFISQALQQFDDEATGLVQFPQAYYNVAGKNSGMDLEYNYFFSLFMNSGNRFNSVTSTGTMSIYRKQAILDAGRWNGDCITEDSELGVRIILSGYRTKYVDKVMGRGLLPLDFHSYIKQRERWIVGNTYILKNYFRKILSAPLSFIRKMNIFLQVSAWHNFIFFPFVVFAAYPLTVAAGRPITEALELSAFTIFIFFIMKVLIFFNGFLRKKENNKLIMKALLTHFGFLWESTAGWLYSLPGCKIPFNRTDKNIDAEAGIPAIWFPVLIILLISAFLLTSGQLVPGVIFIIFSTLLIFSRKYNIKQVNFTAALSGSYLSEL